MIDLKSYLDEYSMPEPNTGCVLWMRALNAYGYGVMRRDGKLIRAHRLAWQLHRDEIPVGMHVLHRCDTPACVNPDHLFLGTQRDNNRDKTVKGRTARGEHITSHKLTPADVIEIRRTARTTADYRAMALRFNVHLHTIYRIVNRSEWRWLP